VKLSVISLKRMDVIFKKIFRLLQTINSQLLTSLKNFPARENRAGISSLLLFEPQSFYKLAVCFCIFTFQVLEEATTFSNFLEKTTAGAKVLAVGFKVSGELLYFFRKNRDLHLR